MPLPATVELTNTLPDVVLAGNKVPLQFQASENYLENEGSKAEVSLQWTAVAVADEYFDLLLYGETVRFTCKAAPDTSGVQFHDNSLGGTLAEWVALVGEDLLKNYLIARYYDLVVDDDTITLTAKETGAAYTLEFTPGAGIDVIADETDKTGVDRALREFYYVVVLLFADNQFVTELLLNIDDDGLAECDVSEYLKAYVSQDFQWPESDAEFIYDRSAAIKSWYFRYGERWGDSDYKAMSLSDTYYVMHGGVSWMQQAKYNEDGSDFWTELQASKNFLTSSPLIRHVGPEDPIKLFYLNYTGSSVLSLMARVAPKTISSLIASFTNSSYEETSFTGVERIHAKNTISAGTLFSNAISSVIYGDERIRIKCSLTLLSGQLPNIQLILPGVGLRSDIKTMTQGSNDFYLTAASTGAGFSISISNSAASEFIIEDLQIYKDGVITVDDLSSAQDKAIYEMILSPALVGYAGISEETTERIEIWIENLTKDIISEIRTFYLDYNHYEHVRYFIFKNSLGAFEVLRTTGLMQTTDEYERESTQQQVDSDYTSKDREELSVMNLERQKFLVNMGWLSKFAQADEYRNWLRDFSLSKEVYQAIGNTLIPIKLTGTSFDHGKDRDNLKAFSFEFISAYTDEFFSKEIDT